MNLAVQRNRTMVTMNIAREAAAPSSSYADLRRTDSFVWAFAGALET